CFRHCFLPLPIGGRPPQKREIQLQRLEGLYPEPIVLDEGAHEQPALLFPAKDLEAAALRIQEPEVLHLLPVVDRRLDLAILSLVAGRETLADPVRRDVEGARLWRESQALPAPAGQIWDEGVSPQP